MNNMKIIYKAKLGLVCGIMLLLTACSYYQHYAQKNEHRKQCRMQCEQRFQCCLKVCDDNKALCRMKSKVRAAMHFSQYRQQQNVKGQIVSEELNSFRDPLACRKTTCDCVEDKNMCQQACRGSIRKRLQYTMQLK